MIKKNKSMYREGIEWPGKSLFGEGWFRHSLNR